MKTTDYTLKYGIILDEPLNDTALDEVQRRKTIEWFEKSFAERLDKSVGMILIQGGNTAATADTSPKAWLTAEKMTEMMREFKRAMPPPVRVDLYGMIWALKRMEIYRELRDAGVDVRLEPRYGPSDED